MTKLMRQFRYGQKGFTLIELLVVVAILGVLAAVAVPNVGSFISRGRTEAAEAELHNVQTATTAMLADSASGQLDAAIATATSDMTTVLATQSVAGDLNLAQYMTGLTAAGLIKSGRTYTFALDGTVTQTP